MALLDGRVAVITGAGRGLGRHHALLFADQGASVVVNDVDGDEVAQVVAEITAAGGRAVGLAADISLWESGRRLVDTALEAFGHLDVLVNNAGNLADRFIVNMTEQEWDDVIRVHLKGHFGPLQAAAAHWRDEAKAGRMPAAAVVNTTSTSGLSGNPGQANYGAAKAGIAALTVMAAGELDRYGVRVNAVAPLARTRLTESTPAIAAVVAPPVDPTEFDAWHPANVSPVVAVLASEDCRITGQVFLAHGGRVQRYDGWSPGPSLERSNRWEVAELAVELDKLAPRPRAGSTG